MYMLEDLTAQCLYRLAPPPRSAQSVDTSTEKTDANPTDVHSDPLGGSSLPRDARMHG